MRRQRIRVLRHAGTGAANVVPGSVEVDFNFRFSTQSTETSLRERVESILAQHKLEYAVRWTLGQACQNSWRMKPNDPLVRWAKQVAERRGRGRAIVAMTRKLAGILFALWRDGTTYDPKRLEEDSSIM